MTTPTAEQLIAVAQMDLLIANGVDNWEWYEESVKNYVPTGDTYVDAVNFVDALDNGGVGDWDGCEYSLEGLGAYEDYVESVEDLSTALNFDAWEAQKNAPQVVATPEDVSEPAAAVLRAPEGETEQRLLDYIATRYGASEAATVFDAVVSNGFWRRITFPKQYDKAIKSLVEGETLETPRRVLFDDVVKSGAINAALDQLK